MSQIDRRLFLASAAALAPAAVLAQTSGRTAWTFSFPTLEGGRFALSDHAGKVLLVVNTASLCGYTPQYAGLDELHQRFEPKGLVVIGVPSNDHGGQEPGGAAEILATAHIHHVSFPLMAKAKTVGADAHPFYRWAAQEKPRDLPRWNFHKYVVGRDGRLVAAFPSAVAPSDPALVATLERELDRIP